MYSTYISRQEKCHEFSAFKMLRGCSKLSEECGAPRRIKAYHLITPPLPPLLLRLSVLPRTRGQLSNKYGIQNMSTPSTLHPTPPPRKPHVQISQARPRHRTPRSRPPRQHWLPLLSSRTPSPRPEHTRETRSSGACSSSNPGNASRAAAQKSKTW